MGLITMRQRIEALGGKMALKPASNGTSWLFSMHVKDNEIDG